MRIFVSRVRTKLKMKARNATLTTLCTETGSSYSEQLPARTEKWIAVKIRIEVNELPIVPTAELEARISRKVADLLSNIEL